MRPTAVRSPLLALAPPRLPGGAAERSRRELKMSGVITSGGRRAGGGRGFGPLGFGPLGFGPLRNHMAEKARRSLSVCHKHLEIYGVNTAHCACACACLTHYQLMVVFGSSFPVTGVHEHELGTGTDPPFPLHLNVAPRVSVTNLSQWDSVHV